MRSTEALIRRRPVAIERRVKWGECDPAGVVYTAVFADYVISAAELVTVAEVRERTYVLQITASTSGNQTVFVATLTPVCVARTERRSIPIPESFRACLLDYRADCREQARADEQAISS